MPTSAAPDFTPSMSDEAVMGKTGRNWAEWFSLLDAAGAQAMTHRDIVKLLSAEHVPAWWCQTVTVNYEQARGLREKYQAPTGYQANGSKTVPVPLEQLFAAWTDDKARGRWMGEATFTVRKATPSKSLRLQWDDSTLVDANFYALGPDKSKVQLQHSKLADAKHAERLKAFWKERLDRLADLLHAAPRTSPRS